MAQKIAAAALAALVIAGGGWWAMQQGDSIMSGAVQLPGAASAETAAPATADSAAPAATAATATAATETAATETAAAAVDPALLADRSLGNPDAPVKIIEYASFTCPHCAHFNETVFKQVRTNYIDTGKVYFTLREVYFDKFGLLAGMMARCGGEDRYFGFVETFYHNRDTWLGSEDPAAITESLKRIGRTGGMSDEQIDACWANRDFANALVEQFQKNMTADAVEGTPTFLINGEKFTNMDYEAFAKILDDKLK